MDEKLKIIITQEPDGTKKAHMDVRYGLGKVSEDPKSICCMYSNGAMSILEMAIQNKIAELRNKRSVSTQDIWEQLLPQFHDYMYYKLVNECGIMACTLTLLPDGTIDGLAKGIDYEVVYEVVLENE